MSSPPDEGLPGQHQERRHPLSSDTDSISATETTIDPPIDTERMMSVMLEHRDAVSFQDLLRGTDGCRAVCDAAKLNRMFLMRLNHSGVGTNGSGSASGSEQHFDKVSGRRITAQEAQAQILWDDVRNTLSELRAQPDRAKAAMLARTGESKLTLLHVSCMNRPPLDVIQTILSICPESSQVENDKEQLPIHLAARHGASHCVIKALVKSYPMSIDCKDALGRVPIHWTFDPFAPSSASKSTLRPRFSYRRDQEGREVPDPSVVRLLQTRENLDMADTEKGKVPSQLFKDLCKTVPPTNERGRERAKAILYILLQHATNFDDTFFQCLLAIPHWCLINALGHPFIKDGLNRRSSEPMVTTFLMLDLVVQTLLIASFTLETKAKAEQWEDDGVVLTISSMRYVGIAYIMLRIILKVKGFFKIHKTRVWFCSGWNWVELGNVMLLLSSTIIMDLHPGEIDQYRVLVTVTGGLQWIALLPILRVTNIPFSIFVTGLVNIMINLVPFIVTTFVLLGAFSFMYYTLNYDNEECAEVLAATSASDYDRWSEQEISFCTNSASYLNVYTMFVGDIGDDAYESNRASMWLSIVFAFLMVVLQLNVLIAVITDSYSFVKDRGEEVFWQHRFFYLADVDSISRLIDCHVTRFFSRYYTKTACCRRMAWDKLTWTLFDDSDDYIVKCSSVWMRFRLGMKRTLLLLVAVIWILAGFVSLGWLWPPQIREMIFCQGHGKAEDAAFFPPDKEDDDHGKQEKDGKTELTEVDLNRVSFAVKRDVRELFDGIDKRMGTLEEQIKGAETGTRSLAGSIDILGEELKDVKQSVVAIHQMMETFLSAKNALGKEDDGS